MKIIVGLGNPGPKYLETRHNVGFILLDRLADKASTDFTQVKFDGIYGKGELFGETVLLVKPMTFMNVSGRCVGSFCRFFKIEPQDLIVIQDDIDMAPGKVKLRTGGGHGGHNGIRDIIKVTGQNGFHRIKYGVGKPANPKHEMTNWVLGKLSDEEFDHLDYDGFEQVCQRIEDVFRNTQASK